MSNSGPECPICNQGLISKVNRPNGRDANSYSCPQCGSFILSRTLVSTLPNKFHNNPAARAKVSHAIKSMQKVDEGVELHTGTIDEILKKPLPTPKEQADLLLRWIADSTSAPGEEVNLESIYHNALIGAQSSAGFEFVLQYLLSTDLISGSYSRDNPDNVTASVIITFSGWDHYESLTRGGAVYHKAFMAMKFGDPMLNNFIDDVFRPAVRQTGFDLTILSDVPRAGLIDDRLRVEIQSSDFLIADLTHDNHGAYWEAGYAEGLGKPVIYSCEVTKFKNKKTHFDTNHHLTIVWDIENPQHAADELKATIRATLPSIAKQEDTNV